MRPEQIKIRTEKEIRESILRKRATGEKLDPEEIILAERDREESQEELKGGLYGQRRN